MFPFLRIGINPKKELHFHDFERPNLLEKCHGYYFYYNTHAKRRNW